MTRLPDTDLAVAASGLVKTFDAFRAVDGIDLEIRRGEVFGVLVFDRFKSCRSPGSRRSSGPRSPTWSATGPWRP